MMYTAFECIKCILCTNFICMKKHILHMYDIYEMYDI